MPNYINGMNPITYSPASMDNYMLNPYIYGSSYIPENFGMIANQGGNNFMEAMSLINEGLGTALGGPVGTLLGAGLNFIGGQINADLQQKRQEDLYKKFMSPQARMRDMIEAGINPAAAAQGISGAGNASMPSAPVAAPSAPNLAETLGNSNNSYLSADVAKAQADLLSSERYLTDSQNTEQVVRNRYVERQQLATLENLLYHNEIDKNFAYQVSVDSKYKGAMAEANWKQTCISLQESAQRVNNLTQEYFNMLAQEALLYEQAGFTHNQAVHELHKIGLTDAQISEVYHNIDLIDANKLLAEQQVDESGARTWFTKTQAWYNEQMNREFANTGFDRRSSVDMNFQAALMKGDYKAAERMNQSMQAYIYAYGDARFHSKDYMMDNAMKIFTTAGHLMSANPFGTVQRSATDTWNSVGSSIPGAKIK